MRVVRLESTKLQLPSNHVKHFVAQITLVMKLVPEKPLRLLHKSK